MAIQIGCDFPGGSIVVRAIRGNVVKLRRDTWNSSMNWFYFYFEAESDCDACYEFDFGMRSISTGGVAFSRDRGLTWSYLPMGEGSSDNGFRFLLKKGEPIRFCLGQQYLQEHLERFLRRTPAVERLELCRSQMGRQVELLRLGVDAPDRIPVLFTARHHACEMHANYALEGALEAIAASPEFLKKYTVYAVPFVDKDGVEEGWQGKAALPHDHNRDYIDQPIYPEIAALKKLGDEKRFQIVLDLHCPGLGREKIFFFGSEFPRIEANIEALADLVGTYGPEWLNFNSDFNVEKFGIGWNRIYPDGIPCSRYFASRPWARLSCSNEISYDFANGVLLTTGKLREYGAGLVRALSFLKLQ